MSLEEEYKFKTRIDHDFGYFLDPEKYAPITRVSDEASAVLKLSLILENFLSVFIVNIRPEGSERYIKDARYFNPKVDTCVALGLPLILADAICLINKVRNKFAHNLEYRLAEQDVEDISLAIHDIDEAIVNHHGAFNSESIKPLFEKGINGIEFVKQTPYHTQDKQRRIIKLAALVYMLSNLCAFFLVNEMVKKGIFKSSHE